MVASNKTRRAAVSSYTLHRIDGDAWAEYRHLRLQALRDAHGFIGGNLSLEREWSEADWRAAIHAPGRATWLLWIDGRPVGMTGLCVDDPDYGRGVVAFRASWIDPAHRGRGFTRHFHDVRLSWALHETACAFAVVSHRTGNTPAEQAIRHAGFRHVATAAADWPDGARAHEVIYELDLTRLRATKFPNSSASPNVRALPS